MKPPPFQYAAPDSVTEAIGLLAEHADDEPRVLAGGQSLTPLMNFRLAQPGWLIDLRNITELTRIRDEDGVLVIGAMARQAAVERSPEVLLAAPLLAEALGFVAHLPIRNSGTVGGSIAHADPAAELPAVMLAQDAVLRAAGPSGYRDIPAAEFFLGPFTTALATNEILTEIRIPRWNGGHGFTEFARVHANFAVVAAAALVELDGDTVSRASVALTGVAPTAIRATAAEQALAGQRCDAAALAAAADVATAGLTPTQDLHAGTQTRAELARHYIRTALELAVSRARPRRPLP